MIESIEESILQAVDLAMAAASPASEAKRLSLSHYLALVRKFDEFVAANAGKTLYSADVARQLGVSVRTLHNAVVAIRGMSMHRYMRLRRLWSVRQQLLRGASLQSIKAVALVNGFWHMGEFTALYRESVWRNAAADIVGGPQASGQSVVMPAKRAATTVVLPILQAVGLAPINHRMKPWRHECRSVAMPPQEPFVRNEPARPIVWPGASLTVIPLRGKQTVSLRFH